MTDGPQDPLADGGAAPQAGESPLPQPAGGRAVEAAETVRPALDRLAELDVLPTHEHVDVYDDVHRRLHEALSDLDAARG